MYDIKLHYNWDAMVSMTLHKSYTGSNEGIIGFNEDASSGLFTMSEVSMSERAQ